MGSRGPAPTPTAILKARGSPRGKYRRNHEPKGQVGTPQRPKGLSPAGGRVWHAVLSVVGEGVLTKDNGQTLGRYCHQLVRWWKLAVWLEKNEETYDVFDKFGNIVSVKRHPNVASYQELTTSLLRYEQEFGLTPAARSRITALVGAEDGEGEGKPKGRAAPDPAKPVHLQIAG